MKRMTSVPCSLVNTICPFKVTVGAILLRSKKAVCNSVLMQSTQSSLRYGCVTCRVKREGFRSQDESASD